MTDQTPIEGRVVCDAQAALCRCVKDAGHVEAGDLVHRCDPNVCTGAWTGSFDETQLDGGRDWQPVSPPKAVTL